MDVPRLAVAALVCGCAPSVIVEHPPPPAEISYEGERIRIGVEDGLEVCGSSFAYLERFIDIYLASSQDGELARPIEYYFVTPTTLQTDLCLVSSSCARGGIAYATSALHTHEVVHAIRQLQVDRRRPGISLFEEGFAQWHYPLGFGQDPAFSIAKLPQDVARKTPGEWYDPAAHALSIAASEHDLAAVEELVDRSGEAATPAELDAVVDEVLGVDLAALAAEIDASPWCSAFARARLLVECAAEPLPWEEASWSRVPFMRDAVPMHCDDPRVIGPLDGRVWVYETIDIPRDGRYELDAGSEGANDSS